MLKSKKSFLLFFSIFISVCLYSQAHCNHNSIGQNLYNLTLKNRFRSADSLIRKNDPVCVNDIEYQLAVINHYWWKYLSDGNNPDYIQVIEKRINTVYNLYTGIKQETDDNRNTFLKILTIAFDARMHLSEKSYGKAIKVLSRNKLIIRSSFGREIDYPPFFLTSGLFRYSYAYATGRIPLIPLIDGSNHEYEKSVGILFLKKASLLNDQMVRTESLYFLMKITEEIEKNHQEAEKYCKNLNSLYPENLLFRYFRIRIQYNMGEFTEAIRLHKEFEEILRKNNQLSDSEKMYYRQLAASIFV